MKRAAALLALACSAAEAQSAGEWRNSEQLWRATCAYCHNEHVAVELRGSGLTAHAITAAVRGGPKAMPSFAGSQISDTELNALADWLIHQKKPPSEPTDRVPRHGSRERGR